MSYTKQEFERCTFNPMVEGSMLHEYPRLNEIVKLEWVDQDLDAILRYAICLYDPKSPIVQNERDLNYRRGVAAELAGIDDEEFQTLLYTHTHKYAPELIIKYLMRFPKSKEWMAICCFEFKFYEAAKMMLTPIQGKETKSELESVQKKSLIADELEKDIKRIDVLYKSFFGGDDDLEKKVKRKLTPESISNAF